MNSFLLRNWVRLGQGVARHWQRWEKTYFQEMTAFGSTSPDHQQSPHDKDSCQARECWTKPLGWGQARAEHSGPFLVFQRAVGISKAFQATVKKFILLILLSCSPVPSFIRIFLVSSHSQGIFLWWKGRKGITLTPEPVVSHTLQATVQDKDETLGQHPGVLLPVKKVLGEEKSKVLHRFIFSSFLWCPNSFCEQGLVTTVPTAHLRETRVPLCSYVAQETEFTACDLSKTGLIRVFVTWPGLSSLTPTLLIVSNFLWSWADRNFLFLLIFFSLAYYTIILLWSSLVSEVSPGTTAQGCKISVHLSCLLLLQPNTRKPSGTRSLKAIQSFTPLYLAFTPGSFELPLLLPHTLIWNLGVHISTHSEEAEVCIFLFFYPGVHSLISHCGTASCLLLVLDSVFTICPLLTYSQSVHHHHPLSWKI